MKKFLSISILLFSFPAIAQHSPKEIKKFKISKITKLSVTNGSGETKKHEIWYDDNGNDTAEYMGGELYRRTKYEYNSKGQPVTRTRFKADGKETETAGYNYKSDGSYTISNTDKDFGMTDFTYFDPSGKIIKTASPDGAERIYTYDAKGHLTKIKSKTDNGGVVTDLQYTYNAKGQLIKESSKGDYKWTKSFFYNAKGLIAKSKSNTITDDIAEPEVTVTYLYEFRK